MDFQQKMVVLGCFPFAEGHNADNVFAKLNQKISDYPHLTDKIHAVVRDNAANMVAALNLSPWDHIGCFLHILQVNSYNL